MLYGDIQHQHFSIVNAHVVADTIDYLEMKFNFKTDDWDGLDKWAHFANSDGTVYDIRLTDDCIRKEDHLNLFAGIWKVYLHGNEFRDGEVIQRITTDAVPLNVIPTGNLSGEPFPSVPSAGEQIIAAARASEDAAKAAAEEAAGSLERVLSAENEVIEAVLAAKGDAETAAEAARTAAQAAADANTVAENAQKIIEDARDESLTEINQAGTDVTQQIAAVGHSAVESVQNEGTAQTEKVNNAGAEQVRTVQAEGNAQREQITEAVRMHKNEASDAAAAAALSETNAEEAAKNAALSETNAAESAVRAEDAADRAVNGAAFIEMSVGEDGCLYMEKTETTDIDLVLDEDGNLYMEVLV